MIGPTFYSSDFFIIQDTDDSRAERIKRILLTSPGERVLNVEFGSHLKTMIFESQEVVHNSLPFVLKQDIETWDQTVVVLDVKIEINEQKANVKLQLQDKETKESLEYGLVLSY